jgi:hypothetical protein
MDATPMRRNDGDPKDEAERLLAQQFEVRRVVLGEGRGQLHADEEVLAEAEAAMRDADCVIGHLGELLPWGDGSRATARDVDRGNK